jgi:UDP-N-acetylglucosamine--N-acetylmuramyl-(pentapeptide) pyrophosphoryl-undecaprenol N-acetylglucosamine transferase
LRLLIGAGGTGGHIIPALAIALELRTRKWDVAFIGNQNSMEQTIVGKHGFVFVSIKVQKIYRRLTIEHLKFPFLFGYSLLKSMEFIHKYKPDAVLCTGGFVSGPIALAAVLMGRNLFLQDGNSYPGLTTRLFARFSKLIFIASEDAKKHLKGTDYLLTGNPIMNYKIIDKNQINWTELNLRTDTKKLFVIGGSQGSEVINEAVSDCAEQLLADGIDLIWQTGKNHIDKITAKFKDKQGICCFGFTDRISDFYQMADIAMARAGALSIAELEEHEVPTVFIPLPTSAENHQYKNANVQGEKGVGIVLEQKNLNRDSLLGAIKQILSDFDFYKSRMATLTKNIATTKICETLEHEAGG